MKRFTYGFFYLKIIVFVKPCTNIMFKNSIFNILKIILKFEKNIFFSNGQHFIKIQEIIVEIGSEPYKFSIFLEPNRKFCLR